jgi:hypothetical protein
MKITELLIESQQLDEGPIAQALGRGAGKVARGVANIGKDIKTGFKSAYSGEQPAAQPNATAQGIKQGLNKAFKAKAFDEPGKTPKSAKDINAQGPAGTAPAKTQTGAAAAAIDKTAQATAGQDSEKVGQTLYAQVKAQVNQLDKKGKQRILQLLQKSLAQPAATPAPEAPAAAPTASAAPTEPVKKPRVKKVAPTQAEIDADRQRLMGPNSESTVKRGAVVAESFSLFRKQA